MKKTMTFYPVAIERLLLLTAIKKVSLCFIAALILIFSANAQHQELSEKPQMYKGKKSATLDTTSLLYAFKEGHFNGHFRYFFMSTHNQPGLSNYYANAAGGGLRYETARFHGFQFAVSGFYTFNIGSSNFNEIDDSTGQGNRYEVALFDVENPDNKKDIDRLEELYLKYSYKKSSLIVGRQLLNTPFVNLQDGRMRPTGVEGFWLESDELKNTHIQAGWLYAISPRASTKWFDVGQSIGVFPAGVDENGNKSAYQEHIQSNGILMLGIKHILPKKVSIQAWDMLVKNVLHTQMLQADISIDGKGEDEWYAAAQMVTQQAINDGGNADPSKTYIRKGARALSVGAKTGYKNKRVDASINYNRITAKGRYLMPREWGRDLFFTYLPRERNEGAGDVHAVVVKLAYEMPKQRLNTTVSGGYFDMPDVLHYRLNKYGLPSYTQLNTDIRYHFDGVMKGLEAQLLWVLKGKQGETYQNKRFEFNKVDMSNFNLVMNYHF